METLKMIFTLFSIWMNKKRYARLVSFDSTSLWKVALLISKKVSVLSTLHKIYILHNKIPA